jgi:hypothetical protein
MVEENPVAEITDVVLHLKRAFENKNAEEVVELFTPKALINADGKFHDVAHLHEFLRTLFAAVDQTYLDVLGMHKSDITKEAAFAEFDVDISWVDRRDWLEHSQRLRTSLELVRDPKHVAKESRPPYRISGLTAHQRLDPEAGQVPPDLGAFPGASNELDGSRGGGDIFSFWY